jgi:hypothetical protein
VGETNKNAKKKNLRNTLIYVYIYFQILDFVFIIIIRVLLISNYYFLV